MTPPSAAEVFRVEACGNCGLRIEENAPGEWLHVSTADRECWGYPFYGTRTAFPRREARALSVDVKEQP